MTVSRNFSTAQSYVDLICLCPPATDISVLPSINPDGFARAEEGKCSGTGWEVGLDLQFVLEEVYLEHVEVISFVKEKRRKKM